MADRTESPNSDDARMQTIEGEGGFTGSRDGAPYSGYSPGATSSTYGGRSARELEHDREVAAHDRPLQRDPLGDGLAGGLTGGAVGLARDGVVSAGHVIADAVVETVIGTVESELPHGRSEPTDAGAPHPGEDEVPDATVPDATVQTSGAPATDGGRSEPTDPRVVAE